jgi:hypothetical protein
VEVSNHPTVTLQWRGMAVEIDEGMVPLIEQLWARGIDTGQCCQGPSGEQGFASVTFLSAEDAAAFLGAVDAPEDDDPDSLYQRIGDGYLMGVYPSQWLRWRWEALPVRLDAGQWSFEVWAHFPPSDIPLLVERLTAT